MKHGVSEGVFGIGVGAPLYQVVVDLLVAEAGGERQRVLAVVRVT